MCVEQVWRGGNLHQMSFEQGLVVEEMVTTALTADRRRSGTRVRFMPDESIFKAGVDFDFETLATRFDEQAYLNAGLNTYSLLTTYYLLLTT